MTISYGQITSVLTKAVQEQQAEIEALRLQITTQEEKIRKLESSVNQLQITKAEMDDLKKDIMKLKEVLSLEASSSTQKNNK